MTITVRIKNFTKNELSCRCTCKMFNMDEEFLTRLQAFRYILNMPMTITSAGRCKAHNKAVGGVDTSCHQCETKKATAVDFTCSNLQKAYETEQGTTARTPRPRRRRARSFFRPPFYIRSRTQAAIKERRRKSAARWIKTPCPCLE